MRKRTCFTLLLLLLAAALARGQGIGGYEYWIDDGYDRRVTTADGSGNPTFSLSTEGLAAGLHYLNVRVRDNDGQWTGWHRYFVYLEDTLTAGYEVWIDQNRQRTQGTLDADGTAALTLDASQLGPGMHTVSMRGYSQFGFQGPTRHAIVFLEDSVLQSFEYWIDDDYEGRTVAQAGSSGVSISHDISHLNAGPHYFSFRARDSYGGLTGVQRYVFMVSDSCMARYEYWFDQDAVHTFKQTEGQQITEGIDISHLSPGMHYLNFRAQNTWGTWSNLYRYFVCLEDTLYTDYEVWIDQNRQRTQGSLNADGTGVLTLDASELEPGMHTVSYRGRTALGNWGPTSHEIVFLEDSVPANYEYWLDDDYDQRVIAQGGSSDVAVTMDISHLDCGIHFFNFRCTDRYGSQSVRHRWLVYVPDDDPVAHRPITGYNYTLNDQSEFVDIEPTLEYQMQTTAFDIPDPLDIGVLQGDSCRWTIDDERQTVCLDRETPYTFALMFRNRAGNWSSSVGKDFVLTDSITKSALPLTLGRAATMGKVRSGDFQVVRIASQWTGRYFLQTTQSADLQLWCVGNPAPPLYISADSLLRGQSINIEAGQTYYLIVGHTPTDAANPKSTVDIMLKESIGKVLTPVIRYEHETVTITCQQEGVDIYYTLDGSNPTNESARYTGPFSQVENCTVKAVAVADDMDYSDVAIYVIGDYKVKTPVITIDGWTMTIACTTENATIRYSLDDSDPTTEAGLSYNGPVTLTANCLIRAVAQRTGYFDSDEAHQTVDWLQVETPVIAFADSVMTVTCLRPNATIYYEIGGTVSRASQLYKEPVVLEDNRPVQVFATAPDVIDSEVAILRTDTFACHPVSFVYDGRYLRMNTYTRNATIRYRIDNNGDYKPYTGEPIEMESLCTVSAIAEKPDVIAAEPRQYEVDYLYDGITAWTAGNGLLERAFEWCGQEQVATLQVVGSIDDGDLATIRRLPKLHTLNLSQVLLPEQSLPDRALAGANMTWVTTPLQLEAVGSRIFEGCNRLCAVTWSTISPALPADALGQDKNPNLLLYVRTETAAPQGIQNVVSNGVARSILLNDSADFFCPVTFVAGDISYTHEYTQPTVPGVCQGWETLALPFDVQSVAHERNGRMAPFAIWQASDGLKPYWLGELNDVGFLPAWEIKANTPYIIAMPNNASYADDYILEGRVTFASRNVSVPVTEAHTAVMGGVSFIPTMRRVPQGAAVYAINSYAVYDETHPEGSIFLADSRDVMPFEAYTTTEANAARLFIAISDLLADAGVQGVLPPHATVGRSNEVSVYTVGGRLVRRGPRAKVMQTLPHGIYIIDGRKVVR